MHATAGGSNQVQHEEAWNVGPIVAQLELSPAGAAPLRYWVLRKGLRPEYAYRRGAGAPHDGQNKTECGIYSIQRPCF
jgi:hypothetical protein